MSGTSGRPEREPDAELAAFVADLGFEDLPDGAVRTTERVFVDTAGVTVAGAAEGAGELAVERTGALSGGGDATLVGADAAASVTDASFANATAGHGLDFDDVTWGVWHPSVPMVAPILAVAERAGATGREAITAYVAGYETQCYLAHALLPSHYERGWHPTATVGRFGAAAAAASLLGPDTDRTRHALGIAASTAAGLKANFGSATKPLHAGLAARDGVAAGLLAAGGIGAGADPIGGEGGFGAPYEKGLTDGLPVIPPTEERVAAMLDGTDLEQAR